MTGHRATGHSRRRIAVSALCSADLALTALVSPMAAHADPAPAAVVPTADQVAGLLSRLTDPATPDPDKAALAQGGLSPNALAELDRDLTGLSQAGSLPFAINVSDIQPAPNEFAGVTVSITGHHIPIPVVRPMVLVKQGDTWLFTPDSVDPTLTQELRWILDRVGSRDDPVAVGPPLPPFSFVGGR